MPERTGGSGSEVASPIFAFAGIDLVRSRDGRWFVLEVNDHPSGLLEADQRAGTTRGVDALAEALITRAGGGTICLLLPECFHIAGDSASASTVARRDTELFDDARIRRTIDEFNALLIRVNECGHRAVIADVAAVSLAGREVVLHKEHVSALYRRAYQFPLRNTDCAYVNDVRLRAICPDKRRTAAVLRGSPRVRMPETFHTVPDAVTCDRYAAERKKFIVKPNFGSASAHIQRLATRDLPAEIIGDELLWQEWIEPATVVSRGREYYYDVRVYVVDGQVVSRIVRRAAAPCDDTRLQDSALAWLTTTGPWFPLVVASGRGDEEVALPENVIGELDELCVDITAMLDAAARNLDYTAAAASIRPFSALSGVTGAVQRIELAPN